MKIIFNKILPFPGFYAINLFGILFVRSEYAKFGGVSSRTLNHERIHTEQMRELWYVGFYLLYLINWIVRLVCSPRTAYRGIAFEREAYDNESNLEYLGSRKPYAWVKLIFRDKTSTH